MIRKNFLLRKFKEIFSVSQFFFLPRQTGLFFLDEELNGNVKVYTLILNKSSKVLAIFLYRMCYEVQYISSEK